MVIRILVIKGDTRLEDVYQGKAPVFYRHFQKLGQMLNITGKAACHEAGIGSYGQGNGINGMAGPQWCGLGNKTEVAGRRGLFPCVVLRKCFPLLSLF